MASAQAAKAAATEAGGRKKLTKAEVRKRRNLSHRVLRWCVQLAFLVAFPSVFSEAFNGVKGIFTQMGQMQPLEITAFTVTLVAVLGFTVVFGRFFCGFACVFGTLGDAVYALAAPLRRRLHIGDKPLPASVQRVLQYVKYLVLAVVCVLCLTGLWQTVSPYSPWTAFAGIVARSIEGIVPASFAVLAVIVVGMAVVERFFCQFLCPLGAVFSLLPVLPFSTFGRRPERCAKSCGRCHAGCPVSVYPDPAAPEAGECIACGRCADGCPLDNVSIVRIEDRARAAALLAEAEEKAAKAGRPRRGPVPEAVRFRLSGSELGVAVFKAAALFALCWFILR